MEERKLIRAFANGEIALSRDAVDEASKPQARAGSRRPKTAPGVLLQFLENREETKQALSALQREHAQFEGAEPARKLDPSLIAGTAFGCRMADSFFDATYQTLKESIASTGGNVQHIKVRPISPRLENAALKQEVSYEIVFGHRRHRACQELRLPVAAVISHLDDKGLFLELDASNRGADSLSAYERSLGLLHALNVRLFPTPRSMAHALGLDETEVNSLLALATLPWDVLCAFPSLRFILPAWGGPLQAACLHEPQRVVTAATRLRESRVSQPTRDPAVAFAADRTESHRVFHALISTMKEGEV